MKKHMAVPWDIHPFALAFVSRGGVGTWAILKPHYPTFSEPREFVDYEAAVARIKVLQAELPPENPPKYRPHIKGSRSSASSNMAGTYGEVSGDE